MLYYRTPIIWTVKFLGGYNPINYCHNSTTIVACLKITTVSCIKTIK